MTHSQIRSLFANFVKFGSKQPAETSLVKIENLKDVNDEELQCALEEMDSVDFHTSVSDLAADIISELK